MINDIISDSLTRIRNAGMRKLETTKLLHSKVVEALVGIFQAKGYIESFNVIEED
ncbi:30S ribosomal protein S8, partial [Campylobacter sp. CH185]